MSVTAILQQPELNSLHAAYRAILSRVVVDNISDYTPPAIVYCDIYINGIFYKTITRTFTATTIKESSEYVFDIQDALQEYLDKRDTPINGGTTIQNIENLCKVYCKYRSSTYSPAGFIVPEGLVPQQGTSDSPAIPGGGVQSNSFYVINAVLQHSDNQNISNHLEYFKNKTWSSSAKPATHRPKKVGILIDQSDYFPIIVPDSACPAKIRFRYKYHDQNLEHTVDSNITPICNVNVINITSSQVPSSTEVTISWQTTDIVSSCQYRIDNGVWITSTSNTLIEEFEEGEHTIDVRAVCSCGIGPVQSYSFEVQSPEVYVCESTISSVVFNQVTGSSINYTITAVGAYRFKLEVDGGTPYIVNSTVGSLTGLTAGTHSLKVTPICENNVEGTSFTQAFNVIGMPSVTQLSSTVSGNDIVQTFKIGSHVATGNKFKFKAFGQEHVITATSSDTPTTIAGKVVTALTKSDAGWYSDNSMYSGGYYPDPEDPIATGMYLGQMPPYFASSGDEVYVNISWPEIVTATASIS